MKNRREVIDREYRDGKPYFGIRTGYYSFFHDIDGEKEKTQDWLLEYARKKEELGLELRDIEFLPKPGYFNRDPLNQVNSVAIKFTLWGRAYKVMRVIDGGL